MGTNDLAKETRARQTPGRAPMLAWLSMAIAAARAHGIEIVDGVFGDIADAQGFRGECEQGRDLGMDGKTLIHPDQIAICNAVFAPAPDEIALARKIVAAFDLPENASRGAIAIEGRMVERLHADMARRTLAFAAAIDEFAKP
jgi:citrate lyase subunit beta/citryl-CoA lyase